MGYILYVLGRTAATFLWLLGMLCFAAAHRINLLVYQRLAPHRTPANCAEWASLDWDKQQRDWQECGGDQMDQPYLVVRTSRQRPAWVMHAFTAAYRNHDTGAMPLESFAPIDPKDVPLWRCWERLNFAGYVKRGDRP